MSSISSVLSNAVQSLLADTGALQVTSNNIANANTPGYSRQVPVFQEAAPTNKACVMSWYPTRFSRKPSPRVAQTLK
jgi:flagellar hook-associated protein FlgK